MALGSNIRAGAAFVELKSKDADFVRGMKRAQRTLDGFGAAAMNIGRGLAIAGSGFGIIAALSIKSASDAEESLNRFGAVFKDQTDAAAKFAEQLAERVGRSSIEIKDSLASLQGFFLGLGFDGSKARQLSQDLTSLAIDFASFNNLSDEEAIGRFISALSGSSEVLDKYGINIKQAALQQELLALGINKAWSQVTEQEKALARYSIIARTMGEQGAVGDAAKTSGSFANQLKRLGANVKDARTAIGQALLPIATKAIVVINAVAKSVVTWIKANKGAVLAIAATGAVTLAAAGGIIGIGLAAQVAAFAIGGLVAIFAALGTAIGVAGSVLATILSPIGIASIAIVALGATVLALTTDVSAMARALVGSLGSMASGATGVVKSITDALTAGDLKLAVEIAGTGMRLAWAKTLDAMLDRLSTFKKIAALALQGLGFGKPDLSPLFNGDSPRQVELEEEIKRLTEELRKLQAQKPDSPFEGLGGVDFESLLSSLTANAGASGQRSASGVFETNALRNLATPVEQSIEQNTKLTAEALRELIRLFRAANGGLIVI